MRIKETQTKTKKMFIFEDGESLQVRNYGKKDLYKNWNF